MTEKINDHKVIEFFCAFGSYRLTRVFKQRRIDVKTGVETLHDLRYNKLKYVKEYRKG